MQYGKKKKKFRRKCNPKKAKHIPKKLATINHRKIFPPPTFFVLCRHHMLLLYGTATASYLCITTVWIYICITVVVYSHLLLFLDICVEHLLCIHTSWSEKKKRNKNPLDFVTRCIILIYCAAQKIFNIIH